MTDFMLYLDPYSHPDDKSGPPSDEEPVNSAFDFFSDLPNGWFASYENDTLVISNGSIRADISDSDIRFYKALGKKNLSANSKIQDQVLEAIHFAETAFVVGE